MSNGFWNTILGFFGVSEATAAGPEHPVAGEADAMLQALVTEGRVPGLAVAAIRDGRPVLVKGYGYACLESNTPVRPEQTVFRVASVSKPITATALARMVAAGQLGLDDPLERYVPEFPHKGISLRQLAAHTAGLRGYRGKEWALNRPYSIADSLEVFRDDPLLFPPGTSFQYNSFDFILLSLAMERVAGMPFHKLVRKQVTEPFGMVQTTQEVPGSSVPGQAACYTRQRSGFRLAIPVDNRFKLAGGGYLSTVSDLTRLGKAYLEGRVAPEPVLREFLKGYTAGGTPTWYGLGWQVSQDASGRRYFGHIGNGVGGYSNFFIYPESGWLVSILTNCTDPGIQPYLDLVIASLLDSPSP